MSKKQIENRNKLMTRLQSVKPELVKQYHVKQIGLFGSFARGQQTTKSDIDVLVEFAQPISLFKFLELEEYLEKVLGLKVDLVSRKALKPRIGKHILNEVVMV